MSRQLVAVIAIGTVVLAGGVYVAASSGDDGTDAPASATQPVESTSERGSDAPAEGADTASGAAGSFVTVAADDIAGIDTDKRVLFFHASWCSTCKALASDISDNESEIPAGLTIARVDFDEETDLKKQYGVTVQHTLVQIDEDGNEIARWSGSPDLVSLVGELA
jgi:thioredoxin 1